MLDTALASAICVLLWIAAVPGQAPQTRSSAPEAPASVQSRESSPASRHAVAPRPSVEHDVTYCQPDHAELKLDLYRQHAPDGQPLPVILFVHGGAWHAGDKAVAVHTFAMPELMKRGYAVASINYRPMPGYGFPAQIEDVKCAVRFLRAQASRRQLSSDHIGALGTSAGGHLVALLGMADAAAGLEGTGGWPEQSSRVQAVVDLYGMTDLVVPPIGAVGRTAHARALFGDEQTRKRASPVMYVSGQSPPFLIVHGEDDHVVPLSQSQDLHDRLTAAGALSTLVIVRHAGHNLRASGQAISPPLDALARIIADFFDGTLKR